MARFTIGGGFKAGLGLIAPAWRHAGLALALVAVANTVFNSQRSDAPPSDSMALIMTAGLVAFIVMSFMATGALLRLTGINSPQLRLDSKGPGGIQWGSVEWSLVRLSFVIMTFVVVLAVALALGVIAILMLLDFDASTLEGLSTPAGLEAYTQTHTQALAIGALALLAVYALMIWVCVRLSLCVVATGAAGKVRFLRTWRLTKGHFWRLFGGLTVVALPGVVAMIITMALIIATSGAVPGESPSREVLWGVSAVASLVSAFIIKPMQMGLLVEAYKQLTSQNTD